MYVIDTNVFLEVLLKQERKDECGAFLSEVFLGELEAVVTDFLIDSIVIRFEKEGKEPGEIRKFLASLLVYKGLSVHAMDMEEKIAATQLMESYGLDFDDALQAQAVLANEAEAIVSFDTDFDRVGGIKRVEPKDILARGTE